MAIEFAQTTVVHAGPESSAVGLAAYITRSRCLNTVTGIAYDFTERAADLRATGTVFPTELRGREPEWAKDVARLWSKAEEAELLRDGSRFRSGAQLAKSQILALPNELSLEENIELVGRWIEETWARHGAVVTWAIHAPDEGEENWHAHLLISTRELTESGFGRKLRELNPRFIAGAYTRTRHDGCDRWREMQNEFFRERGIDAKVDPQRIVARRRFERKFLDEELAAWRGSEAEAVRVAWKILECLTRHQDCFTERDLARVLHRAEIEGEEFEQLREEVLANAVMLAGDDGEPNGYYTTWEARREAEHARDLAVRIAESGAGSKIHAGDGWQAIRAVEERAGFTFAPDQYGAVQAACGERFSIWRGVAGAGKSAAVAALVEAHVLAGYRTIAVAPTNTVARDLGRTIEGTPSAIRQNWTARRGRRAGADSAWDARTIHSLLWQIEHGRIELHRRTLVVVDEAAMVDTKTYGRLLGEVERSGAKLVLVGDDRQLGSIERGGLFRIFLDEIGPDRVRALERVRRQRHEWQREATTALAEGRFADAVEAYGRRKAITFAETLEGARESLVRQWMADERERPNAVRFVYAQTNVEVTRLNAEIQAAREAAGVVRPICRYETERRGEPAETDLGVGDRVQLYGTDHERGLMNGHCGTVRWCEPSRIELELDGGGIVSWNPREYREWGLGYAGTVYRGQGKTQTEAYYLHTAYAESSTSYVAWTRHTDDLRVYAGRDITPDEGALANQMGRHVERGSSLAYEVWEPGREIEQEPEVDEEIELVPVYGERDDVVTWPEPVGAALTERVLEWLEENARGEPQLREETARAMAELIVECGEEAIRKETERMSPPEIIRLVAEFDPRLLAEIADLPGELRAELTRAGREMLAVRVDEHLSTQLGQCERYGGGAASIAYREQVSRYLRETAGYVWVDEMQARPAKDVLAAIRGLDGEAARLFDAVRREVEAARLMAGVERYLDDLAAPRATIAGSVGELGRMVGEYLAQKADGEMIRALGNAPPEAILRAVAERNPRVADEAIRCRLAIDPISIELKRVAGLLRQRLETWADNDQIEKMIETGSPGTEPNRKAIRMSMINQCITDYENAKKEIDEARARMGFAAQWRKPSAELTAAVRRYQSVLQRGKELHDDMDAAKVDVNRIYRAQLERWWTAKLYIGVTTAQTQVGEGRTTAVGTVIRDLKACGLTTEAAGVEKAAQIQGVIAAPSPERSSERTTEKKKDEPTQSNEPGLWPGM